jgi:large subunit ribosomal protein L29
MKAEKIRELDDKELAVQAKETDDEIFRIKFQMAMGQMEGLKKYRVLKKDRARLLTVQRERELAAAKEAR